MAGIASVPGRSALQSMQLWNHSTSSPVRPGFRFADSNDDAMFSSGVVYWEQCLLRFRRKIQPFTDFQVQKSKEVFGSEFVPPPQVPGLLDGACAGINDALVGIMESFQLLIPFKQVRTARHCSVPCDPCLKRCLVLQKELADDIRSEFSLKLFEQFGLALTDNAISDSMWFRILEYIFSQMQQLESELRAPESTQWLDRFRELVCTVYVWHHASVVLASCEGKCGSAASYSLRYARRLKPLSRRSENTSRFAKWLSLYSLTPSRLSWVLRLAKLLMVSLQTSSQWPSLCFSTSLIRFVTVLYW
jgi:hypothetical protein